MLDVLLTFDTELWCGGWTDLDARFPAAFQRYVYGRPGDGDYALPRTLRLLQDHGLLATFFVEPLFAGRFGVAPLAEMVHLLREAGQDVQLHLHPEWADEARPPILQHNHRKRPFLSQYSLAEQAALIQKGVALLTAAGAPPVRAFRAGSFACNRDTFRALARAGILYDSSVDLSNPVSAVDLAPAERFQRIAAIDSVIEYPATVFYDRPGHLRHVQVGACSLAEMVATLWSAREQGRRAFVIYSHNFEMLVPGSTRPDRIVVRRFAGLCRFLAQHSGDFRTVSFDQLDGACDGAEPPPLHSTVLRTAVRMTEQVCRRLLA